MATNDESIEYLYIFLGSSALYLLCYFVVLPKIAEIVLPKSYPLLKDRDQRRVMNNVITGITAVSAVVLSLWVLSNYDFQSNRILADVYPIRVFACVQSAYFIADLIHMTTISDFPQKTTFVLHHVVCMAANYFSTVHKCFAFHLCLRLINESPTPFLCMRSLLSIFGKKKGSTYLINACLFLLTYTFGRIALIPYYYYTFIMATGSSQRIPGFIIYFFYGSNFLFDGLIIFWYTRILRIAYNVLLLKKPLERKYE